MILHAGEEQILSTLISEQLTSVKFVMDYVEFEFNGPRITAVSDADIIIGQQALDWDSP